MRNKLKPQSTLKKNEFELEIIHKFETLEEYPLSKPILIADINGLILYANKTLENKIGFKAKSNLFDLKTDPNLQDLFIKLKNNGIRSFCADLLIQNKEDYFTAYLLNIERVEIKDEHLFIIYFDSQDNKKRITQKINSFNQAIEAVNVGILIANEHAIIEHVSKSFEKFFKVKIENIYHRDIPNALKKYLTQYELKELEESIISKNSWIKVVSEIDNEGDVSYKEIRMNIIKDSFDNILNYIIIANDITKHIHQARLIKISEQRQKSIINNISDPILILRKEKGNLIFDNANNTFYKEVLGKKTAFHENTILEYINPVLHSIIHEAITNLENSDRLHIQFHYTVSRSNQRYLGKVTFTDDQYDNTRLYIINMTDITEQLEIERKLREAYNKEISLNKLKSTFLANMSHEIRTPLNAIVGYSDLLEDDVKAMNYESSAKMTTYLKEGVSRLLKLVDNIVEVSLLESGNEEIPLNKIDLNRLLQANQSSWLKEASLHNIKLKYELCPNNLIVEANEEKLERAIKELVDNSIKYNQENGSVVISTYEIDDEITIQILDTGIGIEKESLDKIFKLFEQVEEVGYTRKYEGAGLGLSLANKLISFMNGTMKIVSELDQGTVISVSFPKK